MKILRDGPLLNKVFHGICSNCGSEIEANRDEIEFFVNTHMGKKEIGVTHCPVCYNSFNLHPVGYV